MTVLRQPAVAGSFYPDDPETLRDLLDSLLSKVTRTAVNCKALIVPHAGYVYSGLVAATAYAHFVAQRDEVRRVVLVGPAHRVPFRGLAVSTADGFATPLGTVMVDKQAVATVLACPGVQALDLAHSPEHSLEVHLPFLQSTLREFSLLPLLVGKATPAQVAVPLDAVWGGRETLVIVSSDLSHYHSYGTATQIDRRTAAAIERLRYEDLGSDDACGYRAIGGLLLVARQRGLRVTTLDVRNSGDTAGPRGQVVGYGAFLVEGE
jgi:hypothetical protein